MKSTLIIALAAALATALPQAGQSASQPASDIWSPVEVKKPYLQHKGGIDACFKEYYTATPTPAVEEYCGTKYFCEVFKPIFTDVDEEGYSGYAARYEKQLKEAYEKVFGYKTEEECLADREKA